MTTPTPDNAARATPVAWQRRHIFYRGVDGRTEGERVVSERKVYENDEPLYSAATVTALEERVAELEASIEWVRAREEHLRAQVQRVTAVTEEFEGMTGAGYRYMAANIREALTGAGAK